MIAIVLHFLLWASHFKWEVLQWFNSPPAPHAGWWPVYRNGNVIDCINYAKALVHAVCLREF